MKAKRIIFVMLGVALTAISCNSHKDIYRGEKVENTADLVVPQGFDWSTLRSVEVAITSPEVSFVSVYSTPDCSENSLLATVPVSSEATLVTLNVTKATEAVYIQYPVQGGKKVVTLALDPMTKADKSLVLPEDVEAVEIEAGSTDLMTLRTSGMVAFEDNWPELGDYDMNDLVASYVIDTRIAGARSSAEAKERQGISASFFIHAIGGAYPESLGLKLDQIPAKYIREVLPMNGSDGLTVKLANGANQMEEDAVILVSGLSKLKNGNQYYNTSVAPAAGSIAPVVSIDLLFNENGVLDFAYNCYNQNFFITTVGGREIHLKGYEPTFLYKEQFDREGIEYCNEEGFVWGMKLPLDFNYSLEKTDILKSYNKFADWVTSAGNNSKDWYNYPNAGMVIKPSAIRK